MASLTQKHRELALITSLGEDILLLRSISFHEQLGQLFSLDAELLCGQEDIAFEDLLGENATVRLDMPGGAVRYINGYITQFAQAGVNKGFIVYRATLSPWLWLLTRTSDCRIFQDKTVPDIIAEVFQGHGFTDFEKRLEGNYRTWEYCVQYRETDFNFISRLMEQEGIYYYFEHENGKHTLILADAYGAHKPLEGYENIPYYPPDDTVVRSEDYISHWSISKTIQPGAYALTDYNFKKPRADISSLKQHLLGHASDNWEVFDYPGEYVERNEGENYTQIRLQEQQTQYEGMFAQSNTRGMAAGGLFNLKKFIRQDQNKEYLVVSVTHTAQQDLFSSSGDAGTAFIYRNNFSVLDSAVVFRPARKTPKPVIQGVQTAVVVGPKGEEIYTDEYGRVKCQFHWDRRGEFNERSSCWIRVGQVWAGIKWGNIVLPRLGHEVIVSFLEGDPDRPLITGSVYNADNMPPNGLPANKTQMSIKSDSYKGAGFNEIRFEDMAGKEEFFIHAQKDNNIVVGNNQSSKVHSNRSANIGKSDSVSVGASRSLSVGGSESISVGANRSKNVGKNETLNVGKNRTDTISKDDSLSVGQNRSTKIAANDSLSVGGGLGISVSGDQSTNVGGKNTLTIKGEHLQSSDGKHAISAKRNIEIESTGGDIILSVGGASIKISKSGSIEITATTKVDINGMVVNLNCGGSPSSISNLLSKNPEDITIDDVLKILQQRLDAASTPEDKARFEKQIAILKEHQHAKLMSKFADNSYTFIDENDYSVKNSDSPKKYDPSQIPSTYERLNQEALEKITGDDNIKLIDNESGFAAAVYRNKTDGSYIIAYRGTENSTDWATNIKSGSGFKTAQYEKANALASALSQQGKVELTGHSLGGGLSNYAALKNNLPSTTFNPKGTSWTERMEIPDMDKKAAQLINNHKVDGEILTLVQEKPVFTTAGGVLGGGAGAGVGMGIDSLIMKAPGNSHALPAINPITGKEANMGSEILQKLNIFSSEKVSVSDPVSRHGMDYVQRGLDAKTNDLIGDALNELAH